MPGIYRSQAQPGAGRESAHGHQAGAACRHGRGAIRLGTSPLRRYVDLVNQWQIIACARHGRTAALAAPFKPKDAALFSVISGFDAAYAAYNGFQAVIERYWTLRWLQKGGITEIDAAVMKDGLVRADTLPLVFRLAGTENLAARLRGCACASPGIDLLTLDVARERGGAPGRCRRGRGRDAPDETRPTSRPAARWPSKST